MTMRTYGTDMTAPGPIGETAPDNATFKDTITIQDGEDVAIIKHVEEPGLGGRLTVGLDETARTLVVCDAGDVDTDLGLSASGDPLVNIRGAASSNNCTLKWNELAIQNNYFKFRTLTNQLNIQGHKKITFEPWAALDSAGDMFTFKNASGGLGITTAAEQSVMSITGTVNMSHANAAYNGIKITVTETDIGDGSTGDGGGTNNLILAGTSADPDMFKVDNVGRICLAESSDPAVLADHVFFYGKDVAGTGEAFAADAAANAAQLTPHNFDLFEPDATEAYPWSYYAENKALGIKINVDMAGMIRAVEGLTGKKFIYTQDIAKDIDLEEVYRDKWIEDYIEAGTQEIELTKDQALETVEIDEPDTTEKIGEKVIGYELIEGEIKEQKEDIYKTKKVNKIQTKENVGFDKANGKFHLTTRPTKAQGIAAANTGFTFNPPKWLSDRLSTKK